MLAARDQENLVHGHQAAAASKPLNQGIRQLAPKTPGNKISKTPFKVPLNDENRGLDGRGKTGLKANGKGPENMATGGKKGGLTDNFVTPIAPRNRAPLGLKTTNAKAKPFQTPGPVFDDNDLDKPQQRNTSARKAKSRVSHAEMTKVDILGDNDDFEEREIEYMPPKAKDLPDLPDDHWEPDLTMFKDGGFMKGAMNHFLNKKDVDGLSYLERDEQRQQNLQDIRDRKADAKMQRDMDSLPVPCIHYPECTTELCTKTIAARKAAEEQYRKTIAAIDAETKPATTKLASEGPSIVKAKSSSTAFSQPKKTAFASKSATKPAAKPGVPSAQSRLTTSLASRPRNLQKTPAPTNPSSMRHTAATAASRTTIGYSKGRIASATIRKTVAPKKDDTPDTTLPPDVYIQRYGVPKLGSDKWLECQSAGCFDEPDSTSFDDLSLGGNPNALEELMREQAEENFQLTV